MVITRTIGGGEIAFLPGHAPFLGALVENHTACGWPTAPRVTSPCTAASSRSATTRCRSSSPRLRAMPAFPFTSALVTGASSGIGEEITRQLGAAGIPVTSSPAVATGSRPSPPISATARC